jgi:flagellar hook-length control protein FliK
MPLLNAAGAKAANLTSPAQRATKESKESNFDLLLSASMADSSDPGKESNRIEAGPQNGPETATTANVDPPLPGLPSITPIGVLPENALAAGASYQPPSDSNFFEEPTPEPGAAPNAITTPGVLSEPAVPPPTALAKTDERGTKMDLTSDFPKTLSKREAEIPSSGINVAGMSSLPGVDVKSANTRSRSIGIIATTDELKSSDGKTSDNLMAALAAATGAPASGVEISESARPVSAPQALYSLSLDPIAIPSSKTEDVISIESAVGSQEWTEELSHTAHLLVKNNEQLAEIRLNPADMGPIEIQIEMTQDEATISFAADHAETRNALELALPRLKEMLADSGVSLTDTFVGSDRRQPPHSHQTRLKDLSFGPGGEVHAPVESASFSLIKTTNKSNIDVYA